MTTREQIVPRHVAIIPDGNRRWANERDLSTAHGHQRGVDIFEPISERAADRGVEHLSLWGMSLDNLLNRSAREVAGLMKIFKAEFRRLAEDAKIHERQTRIRVLGRWQERFPKGVRTEIERAVAATASYQRSFLNFFLAYNGTDEMLTAISQMVGKAKAGESVRVTGRTLKKHLFTKDLPPVDLLIRTAGDPHLSAGFMMWDAADAELYFADGYWPDFTPDDFDLALESYAQRRRMKGK